VAQLELLSGDGPGFTLGQPQGIRADEYARTTPWRLGLAADGDEAIHTPLGLDRTALVTLDLDGPADALLYPESVLLATAGRVLPAQTIAFLWWLPLLLVLLLTPVWLRRFAVPLHLGIPAGVMLVAAPVSVWWSFLPAQLMSWALLAAVGSLLAAERLARRAPWWQVVGLVAVSGFGLARLATGYTPWAVPIGLMVLVPTVVAHLVGPWGWRRGAAVLTAAGAIAFLLVAAFLVQNAEALQVLSGTVYPGGRREGGRLTPLWALLGAPHLWASVLPGTEVVGSNRSEISSAHLVLAAPALLLYAVLPWRWRSRRFARVIGLAVPVLILVVWVSVGLPDWTAGLVPLSLSVPLRTVQVVGLGATWVFVVLLADWSRHAGGPGRRKRGAVSASAIAVFLGSATGGTALQAVVPGLEPVPVLAASAAIAAAVAVAVARPRARWALWPLCGFVVAGSALVNPLQFGLHPLRDSSAVAQLRAAHSEADPGYWMTDDPTVDALLMANGLGSVTGQQWVGPDRAAWSVLDPAGKRVDVWNRGASTIRADWSRRAAGPDLTNPTPDTILISVDPCDAALSRLQVTTIVSRKDLSGSDCLQEAGTFPWGDAPRRIYTVRG
jgi:hypothetical protein